MPGRLAARFSAATTYLSRFAGTPSANPLTVCFRACLMQDRNAGGVLFSLFNSNGSIYQDVRVATNGTTLELRTSSNSGATATDLAVGVWVHVAFVRNGTTYLMYVDGEQTGTLSSSISLTPAGFTFGSNSVVWVNAKIQDALVASTVYSQAEIQAEMAAAPGAWANDTAPWAFYPLNGDANDTTDNARHMTVQGAVAWEEGYAGGAQFADVVTARASSRALAASLAAGLVTVATVAARSQGYAPPAAMSAGAVTIQAAAARSGGKALAVLALAGGLRIEAVAAVSRGRAAAVAVAAGPVTVQAAAARSASRVRTALVLSGGLAIVAVSAASRGRAWAAAAAAAGTVTVRAAAAYSRGGVRSVVVAAGPVTVAAIAARSRGAALAATVTPGAAMIVAVRAVSRGRALPAALAAGAPPMMVMVAVAAVSAGRVLPVVAIPGPVTVGTAVACSRGRALAALVLVSSGQVVQVVPAVSPTLVFAVLLWAVPAARIYRIEAEDRRFVVEWEERTYQVRGEQAR